MLLCLDRKVSVKSSQLILKVFDSRVLNRALCLLMFEIWFARFVDRFDLQATDHHINREIRKSDDSLITVCVLLHFVYEVLQP